MRGRIATLTLALALAACASAANAAAGVIDPNLGGSKVSSYGGSFAWSSYDEQAKQYFLTATIGGQVATRLPVPPSSYSFDVDLGAGPDGGISAVYSRCDTKGKHCRLYRYAFGSAGELPVGGVVGPEERSDTEPAISGNQIAFLRDADAKNDINERPLVYVHDLATGSDTRQGTGPARVCLGAADGARARCIRRRYEYVWELDMRAGKVAFLLGYSLGDSETTGTGPSLDIYIARAGGRTKLIARGHTGEAVESPFSTLGFNGRSLMFGSVCEGEECISPTKGPSRFYSFDPKRHAYRTGRPALQGTGFACWGTSCMLATFTTMDDDYYPMADRLVDLPMPKMRRTRAPIERFLRYGA